MPPSLSVPTCCRARGAAAGLFINSVGLGRDSRGWFGEGQGTPPPPPRPDPRLGNGAPKPPPRRGCRRGGCRQGQRGRWGYHTPPPPRLHPYAGTALPLLSLGAFWGTGNAFSKRAARLRSPRRELCSEPRKTPHLSSSDITLTRSDTWASCSPSNVKLRGLYLQHCSPREMVM